MLSEAIELSALDKAVDLIQRAPSICIRCRTFLYSCCRCSLPSAYDRRDDRGTGPMLTMLCAILLLGKSLSVVALIGALLVVLGILVVTGNPFGSGARRPLEGMFWGGAAGAAIANYTVWDSYAVTSLHLAPVSYYVLLLQTLILTPAHCTDGITFMQLSVLMLCLYSEWRYSPPKAYILVLTAMLTAPLALVAPLRESSIINGSLLVHRLFREGYLALRVVGAAIVLTGGAVINF